MEIVSRRLPEWKPGLDWPSGETHVWIVDLEVPAEVDLQCLSADERDRALKFRVPKSRDQFVASRSILRKLLAGYLGCHARAVPIVYERIGKPVLSGCPFHFNVTHSEEVAAFAFAKSGRVGIDIERIRPMDNAESIVERFFTANETAAYRKLPEESRLPVFFKMWTRKEALLKALGQGIHALERCEISVEPEPLRVLQLMDEDRPGERWLLKDVEIAEGYAGAVAMERIAEI